MKEIFAKGSIISFGDEVEAFAPLSIVMLSTSSGLTSKVTSSGELLEFSKENRRILVSHTSTFREEEIKNKKQTQVVTEKAVKQIQQTQQKSTLGDLSGLSDLKKNLEDKGE